MELINKVERNCSSYKPNVSFLSDYLLIYVLIITDMWESTACHIASERGNFDIVQFLVNNDRRLLTTLDVDGLSALHHAADRGHLDVVRFLLDEEPSLMTTQTTPNGWNVCHFAAHSEHLHIVQYLVNKDRSLVNSQCTSGATPGFIAESNNGSTAVLEYLRKEEKSTASKYIHVTVKQPSDLQLIYNLCTGKCIECPSEHSCIA
jgi:ankyrin repeat protein